MVLSWIALALVAGATAYSGIALFGVFRFLPKIPFLPFLPLLRFTPPVSILKPVYGSDRELEGNLESFCRQDYPGYEILFAVREETDEALPVLRRLQSRFPSLPMKVLVLGPPRYPNAKVHALEAMMEAASHEILVISDSDIRVAPDYLTAVVQPLAEEKVGMVTSLSRAVPGQGFWPRLEALGINSQYVAGILSAWVLLGMKFAHGATMAIRKQQVREIGGFGRLGDYLADDFLLGELVAQSGREVALAPVIPDHRLSEESRRESLLHRLRWERSARRSRPAGYWGQIFTHAIPIALAAWLVSPANTALVLGLTGACLAARGLLAWAVAWKLLRDPTFRRYWWLVPVQDVLSFLIWCWAFFGREVVWRGARFRVLKGGKLEAAKTPPP